MSYETKLLQLKETIEREFPNTQWRYDRVAQTIFEQTSYFNRYFNRIQKYTQYSPTRFLQEFLRQELGISDVIVFGTVEPNSFGLTID